MLLCDLSTRVPCPVVLSAHRKQYFDALHSLAHPLISLAKTHCKRIRTALLKKQLGQWAREGAPCKKAKIQLCVKFDCMNMLCHLSVCITLTLISLNFFLHLKVNGTCSLWSMLHLMAGNYTHALWQRLNLCESVYSQPSLFVMTFDMSADREAQFT